MIVGRWKETAAQRRRGRLGIPESRIDENSEYVSGELRGTLGFH